MAALAPLLFHLPISAYTPSSLSSSDRARAESTRQRASHNRTRGAHRHSFKKVNRTAIKLAAGFYGAIKKLSTSSRPATSPAPSSPGRARRPHRSSRGLRGSGMLKTAAPKGRKKKTRVVVRGDENAEYIPLLSVGEDGSSLRHRRRSQPSQACTPASSPPAPSPQRRVQRVWRGKVASTARVEDLPARKHRTAARRSGFDWTWVPILLI